MNNELIGLELDHAVAIAEGRQPERFDRDGRRWIRCEGDLVPYSPSTSWALAGLIIEREKIDIRCIDVNLWWAYHNPDMREHYALRPTEGPTPLIAAMRCFVASKS